MEFEFFIPIIDAADGLSRSCSDGEAKNNAAVEADESEDKILDRILMSACLPLFSNIAISSVVCIEAFERCCAFYTTLM